MQNLTQKQDYLSQQILDQGYDPQQFQQYMVQHSDKQLDLNLWKLDELKIIVKQFKGSKQKQKEKQKEKEKEKVGKGKSMQEDNNGNVKKKDSGISMNSSSSKQGKRQQKSQDQQSDQNDNTKQQQQSKSANNKQQQLVNSKQLKKQLTESQMPNLSSVNSSLYKHYSIQTKKTLPQLYAIAHIQRKPILIQISSYSKAIPNNIFKSQYIQYEIVTVALKDKWEVKRRFTDFIWLQEYMRQKYRGLPVPPIPEKTTMRSFDQRHVDYRMMMLERFLNTCVQIPEICSDPVFELFIRGNQEYYRQMKKKYQQKLEQSANSTIIQSILGEDLLLMDQHTIEPHITNFYKQYSTKLYNLSSQLNILMQDMKKVQTNLNLISSSFQQLSSLLDPTIASSGITSVLYQFTLNMSSHIGKTTKFMKHNLYQLWNYQTLYVNNLYDSFVKIQKQQGLLADKHKNSFLKVSEQGQNTYNNSLQPNKLIKQFQINKQNYRVKLSQTVHQLRRYQKQGMKDITKIWVDGLRNFIKDGIGEWMILCTDGMMKGMNILQGRKLVQVEYIKK